MLAGGHQIVARALGGGGGEDWGGDLQKIVIEHGLAQRGDDLAAQDDVLLDGGVAQVEIAVFETLALVGVAAAVDLKGQLVVAAAAEHLDLLGDDLNVAGGLPGVLAGALADKALDGDGGFLVDGLDDGHHLLGLHNDLGCAVEVAHDDECKVAADLAHVLHPADDLDFLPHMLQAELIAGMGTVLHHMTDFLTFCPDALKAPFSPEGKIIL